MTNPTQVQQTIDWVRESIENEPRAAWARFMYCARSNQHYGHFAERKPKFNRQIGNFYNTGGRNAHFRTVAPSWGIRFNLETGQIRIMETGETIDYFAILQQEAQVKEDRRMANVFKCGYCSQEFWMRFETNESNFEAIPVHIDLGGTTFNVDYDVRCGNCFRETTIRFKVKSPLHIIDGGATNV